jgi:hypothetical protein
MEDAMQQVSWLVRLGALFVCALPAACDGGAVVAGSDGGADGGSGYEGDQPGECADGVDNDRDGFFDCDDEGCAGSSACSGAPADASFGGDGDGDGDVDGDAGGDAGSCGGAGFAVEAMPTNVLIVFDRSCSMRRLADSPDEFGYGPEDSRTRWHVAREAVRRLTESAPAVVRWGLEVFPPVLAGCGVLPSVDVAPAAYSSGSIMAVLEEGTVQPFEYCGAAGAPGGPQPAETPTAEAIQAASNAPSMVSPEGGGESVILLVTDGEASCGATADSLGNAAAQAYAFGVSTAVVGFSGGVRSGFGPEMLESMAASGGMPRSGGPPSYYYAESGAELDAVFAEIVAEAVSCTFALDGTPPDADLLYVFANDDALGDGEWTYDAGTNTITLVGAACDRLASGEIERLDVTYGCPEPVCTPTAEVCDGLDNDCDDEVDESCVY